MSMTVSMDHESILVAIRDRINIVFLPCLQYMKEFIFFSTTIKYLFTQIFFLLKEIKSYIILCLGLSDIKNYP